MISSGITVYMTNNIY